MVGSGIAPIGGSGCAGGCCLSGRSARCVRSGNGASSWRPKSITSSRIEATGDYSLIERTSGAEVTATTPQELKKFLGGMAYSIMGFVKAFQLEPYEGRLILPDGIVKEGSMLIMAVGNSRFAGGGYEVAPQASLTDGLLDIAVVSGLLSDNLSSIVGELRDPMNPRNEHLLYRQLSAFTIETGKPLHVNLDGEPIKGTHFEFRCCPEALSVVRGGAAARQ